MGYSTLPPPAPQPTSVMANILGRVPFDVPRVHKPSKAQFLQEIWGPQKPAVLTGMMDEWPALSRWTDGYLNQVAGDVEVDVSASKDGFFSGDAEKGFIYAGRFKKFRFRDYLAEVQNPKAEDKLYLQQAPLDEQFPPLVNDVLAPPFLKGREESVRLWIGPAGNISPLHYDGADNFLCQVRGRKRLVLFAPSDTDSLYPNRMTSAIPHLSRLRIDNLDLSEYPDVRNATPWECVLNPGEMLFIPLSWWHQVYSTDFSISVNFWYENYLFERLKNEGSRRMLVKRAMWRIEDLFKKPNPTA